MYVYIEYVLIDNFVIDYLMLKATFATTGKSCSKGRLFVCAFLGAIIALIYPLLELHTAILTAVKVLSGILIILLACKYDRAKSLYVHTIIFFCYTFFTGGVIIGVFNLLGIDYSSEISIAIMVIPTYLVIRVCVAVVKYLYRRKDVACAVYDVEIVALGKTVKCRGFFDTGNELYDGDSPVIFCSKGFVRQFLSGDLTRVKLKKICVGTALGHELKLAFKIDEIKIYIGASPNIHSNVTLCVVNNIGDGYELILHPALLRKVDYENVGDVEKVS